VKDLQGNKVFIKKGGIMICDLCGAEMKLIPAGVSKKTGKPYNAFYSCNTCKRAINLDTKQAPIPRKSQPDPYVEGKERNTRLMCRNDLMVELVKKWNDITTINDLITLFENLWEVVDR